MRDVEILILGGGPAGATAALNLSPSHRVVVVDARTEALERIGESLPSAARRLLGDMGLLKSFLHEGHAPWYGNRAVWGGSIPIENDFLRDLNGHGWHLDRARFETWLREIAAKRGATFLTPSRFEKVERIGSSWTISLNTGEELRARLLIDASGRGANLARRLGAHILVDDHLTCRWLSGRATGPAGLTIVEAVEDGWWYTAPLPRGCRVLAFHTRPGRVGLGQPLLRRAAATLEVSRVLKEDNFVPQVGERVVSAFSAALSPCVGAGSDFLARFAERTFHRARGRGIGGPQSFRRWRCAPGICADGCRDSLAISETARPLLRIGNPLAGISILAGTPFRS